MRESGIRDGFATLLGACCFHFPPRLNGAVTRTLFETYKLDVRKSTSDARTRVTGSALFRRLKSACRSQSNADGKLDVLVEVLLELD